MKTNGRAGPPRRAGQPETALDRAGTTRRAGHENETPPGREYIASVQTGVYPRLRSAQAGLLDQRGP